MPIWVLLLYIGSIGMSILLLGAVVSTGNARGLASAITWMSIDLAVTVLSAVVCRLPHFRASWFTPMLYAHTACYAICLVWMAIDAARQRHPLSATFFCGFGVYAVCRLGEYVLYRMNGGHASGTAIWWVDTTVYLVIAGVMLLSLFLPLPPSSQEDSSPAYSAWTGLPVPPAAAARISEVH